MFRPVFPHTNSMGRAAVEFRVNKGKSSRCSAMEEWRRSPAPEQIARKEMKGGHGMADGGCFLIPGDSRWNRMEPTQSSDGENRSISQLLVAILA